MANNKNNTSFRTTIGGQALIEGILMRGPQKQAIVCRTEDGLVTKVDELKLTRAKHPILGIPFLRGVVNFLDSMVKGMQALTYSADLLPEEEQEESSKFDLWVEEKLGTEKANKILISLAVVMGIVLSVVLFMLLPTLIAGFFYKLVENHILRNLIEGLIRIGIFLLYLFLCTRLNDIKRVFSYHGAEHKTIFCYEKGLPLTVENVRKQPRQHPRCGTSFLFVVMIISILVYSFATFDSVATRLIVRILLLPVIVGISYELNRWVGRHDNLLSAILSAPGKALQNLTTFEPDDSMIEVAIRALELVIPEQRGADLW